MGRFSDDNEAVAVSCWFFFPSSAGIVSSVCREQVRELSFSVPENLTITIPNCDQTSLLITYLPALSLNLPAEFQ